MAVLLMPNIGEGVAEGTIVRWLKHEGDPVVRDEPIVEIETDKAVVEVPCPYDGTLSRILVRDDQTVAVGSPIAEFETATVTASPPPAAAPAEASAPPVAATPPVPPTPAVPPTPPVAATPPVPPTPPVAATPPAAATPPVAPTPAEAPTPPVAAAPPVAPTPAQAPTPPAEARAEPAAAPPASPPPAAPAPAQPSRAAGYSPVVSRLAEEHGVDLAAIAGTGLDGRVTRQDVLRFVSARDDTATPPPIPEPAPPPPGEGAEPAAAVAPRPSGPSELRPLSATRRTIARHMTEAHTTIPVAWMVIEADVTGLVALRDRQRREFERVHRVPLTFMPFFTTAIAAALQRHPELNATYADDGIRVHDRVDVGIAVATDSGLLVPVVRDAAAKPVSALAIELDDLGRRARARTLAIEELRDATFTIDNTGALGSVISQPIVPVGQVAIITTEAIRREVRVRLDNALAIQSVMHLAISFDHRALDGAEAGRFMQDVRTRLEAFRGDDDID